MKVKTQFFCTVERKSYKVGDEYTGKRKDIDFVLDIDESKSKRSKKADKAENKLHPAATNVESNETKTESTDLNNSTEE